MKLTNAQLQNFISRIKLKRDNMPRYRNQIENLISKLEERIKNDNSTGLRVTRVLRAGSWKKGTILRPTGDFPIDIDLVFFIEGSETSRDDVHKLHDFVIEYLKSIYPTKDIYKDVDAEGKTKSVKIKFTGTGLEVDIVPVVPITELDGYVWQPERGWTGTYITSVDGQLEFARARKNANSSFTSVVRAVKWWRNYQELDEILKSFTIELIASHLELTKGVETNIEEALIRFFEFVSSGKLKEISFNGAINKIPQHSNLIYVADPTNNENCTTKKIVNNNWNEILEAAEEAYETLTIAQARGAMCDTVSEWKSVFGPNFNIDEE